MIRELHVLLLRQDGQGWGPVTQVAAMTARLAGTKLQTSQVGPPAPKLRLLTRAAAAAASTPFARLKKADLLVIAPVPGALNDVLLDTSLRSRYRNVMAWVIDSFWTERIPATLKIPGLFSHIFITDPDDLDVWRAKARANVEVLPWGTDTLTAHTRLQDPDTDVVRVGRQPAAWDDDDILYSAAQQAGLSFRGRPLMGDSENEAVESVTQAYARSRVVLASGNAASPSSYTHPTKEYVTARWTDAFAHGCLVAGSPPQCGAAATLLPAYGLIQTPPNDVGAGMQAIREHLDGEADASVRLRTFALRQLDWRHRLKRVFAISGADPRLLDAELEQIERIAASLAGEET